MRILEHCAEEMFARAAIVYVVKAVADHNLEISGVEEAGGIFCRLRSCCESADAFACGWSPARGSFRLPDIVAFTATLLSVQFSLTFRGPCIECAGFNVVCNVDDVFL